MWMIEGKCPEIKKNDEPAEAGGSLRDLAEIMGAKGV